MRPVDELEGVVRDLGVQIGVLATPAAVAQEVCDRMVAAGVTGVLNFAPCVLSVPSGVMVRRVDLSTELQILAFHEQRRVATHLAETTDPVDDAAVRHRAARHLDRRRQGAVMSVLVVGLSHRTAPHVDAGARRAHRGDAAAVQAELCRGDHVAEAVVLATCNRLEIYAEVSRFHGGVGELGTAIARATGVDLGELTEHLYVHYEGAAIWHLFSVACGLESMAVGEAQILGQVRSALRSGQQHGSVGRLPRPAASSTPCGSASARTARRGSTAPGRRWSRPAWRGPPACSGRSAASTCS